MKLNKLMMFVVFFWLFIQIVFAQEYTAQMKYGKPLRHATKPALYLHLYYKDKKIFCPLASGTSGCWLSEDQRYLIILDITNNDFYPDNKTRRNYIHGIIYEITKDRVQKIHECTTNQHYENRVCYAEPLFSGKYKKLCNLAGKEILSIYKKYSYICNQINNIKITPIQQIAEQYDNQFPKKDITKIWCNESQHGQFASIICKYIEFNAEHNKVGCQRHITYILRKDNNLWKVAWRGLTFDDQPGPSGNVLTFEKIKQEIPDIDEETIKKLGIKLPIKL